MAPAVEPEGDAPGAPASAPLRVRVGECSTDWLPPGVVRDVPPEHTEELVALLRAWLSEEPLDRPRIDLPRGVAFAKSEDDVATDPPHPSWTAAQGLRACGLTARWLHAHLADMFALGARHGGVRCQGNVCCMAGMEHVSTRGIVLRRELEHDQPVWVLESAYEVAEGTLRDDVVARNRREVARELGRLAAGACPGEPPGLF